MHEKGIFPTPYTPHPTPFFKAEGQGGELDLIPFPLTLSPSVSVSYAQRAQLAISHRVRYCVKISDRNLS
ncbi:hypothetical protein I8752_03550 [Nostocaceae cyanobacterium CENA369]|uniref:Uncharacterized protein n=2 Tax=Dendronalium TaxID=2840442 RepID=A0A8J7LBU1_9NOST|nr:hypothetical protein [Dendronalium phyllosphericum CENA369]